MKKAAGSLYALLTSAIILLFLITCLTWGSWNSTRFKILLTC